MSSANPLVISVQLLQQIVSAVIQLLMIHFTFMKGTAILHVQVKHTKMAINVWLAVLPITVKHAQVAQAHALPALEV